MSLFIHTSLPTNSPFGIAPAALMSRVTAETLGKQIASAGCFDEPAGDRARRRTSVHISIAAYTPRDSLSVGGNRGFAAILRTGTTAQLCAAFFDRPRYPAARCTFRPAFTQANGAEMLRIACCMLVEAGVELCAPIHDAVLIEGTTNAIDEEVARARSIMAEASRLVLGGFEVGTDVVVVRYPDRYVDDAGVEFWNRVTRLAGPLEVPQ